MATCGIITGCVLCTRSVSPGSKTGVSTEDNPAYGVSLNTPHKESGVTQSPSSAAPEAVYEMVPC